MPPAVKRYLRRWLIVLAIGEIFFLPTSLACSKGMDCGQMVVGWPFFMILFVLPVVLIAGAWQDKRGRSAANEPEPPKEEP